LGSYEVARACCIVSLKFVGEGCRSKVEPFVGLYIVLGDTISRFVHHTKVHLRIGIPLSGTGFERINKVSHRICP